MGANVPTIFYTGKLTGPMKWLINASNILAWITGNARDTAAMKRRTRLGYEGACSDDVDHYDEVGLDHYTRIANHLLDGAEMEGKAMVDVGCGTGILSLLALGRGARHVTGGDFSLRMLRGCRHKLIGDGNDLPRAVWTGLDAERLPFADRTFDIVASGMVLGLVPNQRTMVAEMARVLQPGGLVAISMHGPDHYWEAADATYRAMPKRLVIGYRIEYWPRSEAYVRHMLEEVGLRNVRTRRITFKHQFATGEEAYNFFAGTTAAWWNAKFCPEDIERAADRVRGYFERHHVAQVTADVVLAYGERL